jgi:hypothetical protein
LVNSGISQCLSLPQNLSNIKPDYWDVQDLIKQTKNNLNDLAMVTSSQKNINKNNMKKYLEELSNYYREYQLSQQKRVFRKRVLKFFDNNIRVFCNLINSKDFEKTLQMKRKFNKALSPFKT